MTRYLSSFIITSILYSIVIGVFFYAYSNQQLTVKKKVEKKRVSLKHIELVKKIEPKLPVVEKKIIEVVPEIVKPIEKVVKEKRPKVVKKTKTKKIVKKKVKKKIKKITKKKPIKKKKPEKIVEKKIKKIIEPKKIEPVIAIKEIIPVKKIVKTNTPVKTSLSEYKKDFLKKNLQLIKKYIQKNVKYSKRARRMNIEGNVLVEFSLSKNGIITNIKALSGHRLLRKSTIKAIHKASDFFPKVSRNITIKVPISYKLI